MDREKKKHRRKCWRAKDWWKHIFRIFTGKYLHAVCAIEHTQYLHIKCLCFKVTVFRAIFAILPLIVRFLWFYRVEDFKLLENETIHLEISELKMNDILGEKAKAFDEKFPVKNLQVLPHKSCMDDFVGKIFDRTNWEKPLTKWNITRSKSFEHRKWEPIETCDQTLNQLKFQLQLIREKQPQYSFCQPL